MEKILVIVSSDIHEIFIDANGLHERDIEDWTPIDSMEVFTATCFIQSFSKKVKLANKSRSSYGLKHDAERWGADMMRAGLDTLPYISNGAFIQAMSENGFMPVWRWNYGLNCCFKATWKK
jgi:hypothetical protein